VIGGMENGLVNLINQMPACSYRHAVLCVENYSEFRDRITRSDVEVVALNRSAKGLRHVRREVFRQCRRLRPVIVHTRNKSGLDALLPARLAGVPHCIHGEHGLDVDDLHVRRWKPALLRRLHSPLVDRYITVSRHLEGYLRERVGISEPRITQIYNGVDTQRFAPGARSLDGLLPPNMRGERLVVIGTVGRVQPVKDQATLLRAFAMLRARRLDLRGRLRLAVVGAGPLLAELKSLADSLGISPVVWFPGALANIAEVLRTFDVFTLTSLNEGISNTLLEAMASGLPVVATAVGGNLEIVEDGTNGRLFPVQDVGALCDQLEAYATDASLRVGHGVAARRAAIGRFSLAAMVSAYQAVYDQVSHPAGRAGKVPGVFQGKH
jgi:sugar transferase (PEP-CTERM/EpsH1 system associated)